ncbi:MAG: hypothetical protein AB7D30_00700, partial [Lysobacteraceae bacterium]
MAQADAGRPRHRTASPRSAELQVRDRVSGNAQARAGALRRASAAQGISRARLARGTSIAGGDVLVPGHDPG